MATWEVRKNRESVLNVLAASEEEAIEIAADTAENHWDHADSEFTAEELGPDGLPKGDDNDNED